MENLTGSFKDGLVLCAIIHRYRPDLLDFHSLKKEEIAQNNQLAFDILERELGTYYKKLYVSLESGQNRVGLIIFSTFFFRIFETSFQKLFFIFWKPFSLSFLSNKKIF